MKSSSKLKLIFAGFLFIAITNLFASEINTEWSLISKNKTLPQYEHTISLSDVYFIDENVGYACTLNGKIYITHSKGQDWQEVYSNSDYEFRAICFSESINGLVVGKNKTLSTEFNGIALFTGDAGTHWNKIDFEEPVTSLVDAEIWTNNYFFFGSKSGKFYGLNLMYYYLDESIVIDKNYHLGNGDFEIKSISRCNNYAIVTGVNTNTNKQYYYYSNNKVSKWDSAEIIKPYEGYNGIFKKVYCNPYNVSYFLSEYPNQILRTGTNAEAYYALNNEGKYKYNDIVFSDSLTGIVVGENGLLMKTTDAGITWSNVNVIYKNDFKNICYRNGVFFLSADSLFLVSRDYGDTWYNPTSAENNPYFSTLYKDTLKAVYFLNDNRGFFIGNEKKLVFQTFDGCNNFDTLCFQDSGLYNIKKFNSISFTDKLNGFIASDYAYPMVTSDGGSTWSVSHFSGPTIRSVNSMKYIAPNVYVGESNGRSYRFPDTNIYALYLFGDFSERHQSFSVDVLNDTMFAVGHDRNYSRNQNKAFIFPTPLPNFKADYVESFRCIKMLNDTGFVVSDYGIIYITLDNGLSWNIHSSYNKALYSINWKDRDNMYIVGDGIILNSIDGGNSWHEQTIKNENNLDYLLRSVFVTDSYVYACGVNNVILKGKILNKTHVENKNISFKIYPNPVLDYIILDEFDDNSRIKIIDNSGKTHLELIPNSNQIDVNTLPAGSYILNFISNNKNQSMKFIKK